MSPNKAQGQTLDFVGVYLVDHVFAHGQLYVTFRWMQRSASLAVYVDNDHRYTNIVDELSSCLT